MPYDAPPDLASLSLTEIAAMAEARKLPPVQEWDPQVSSDSLMQIKSDGRWFHDSGEITRPAMIRAFSSLLRLEEDGSYWLVTPYEKQSIIVDDAPFIAVEMTSQGAGKSRKLAFRLNTDDLVIAGAKHQIEMREIDGGLLPYLHIRDGLMAKLTRAVYYELVELALDENSEAPAIWSDGACFPLGKTA